MIASEATPDKNKLTTGTLTYDNIENNASYSAGSSGLSYRKFANGAYGAGEGHNMKGLTLGLSVPARGNADSTTTSAIAPGTIEIRENKAQDISALSRDTANSLNELGKIFDKAKIEERQELAAVFGEEAFRLLHNMKDDGSGRKIAAHAIIGGLMSQITGAGFASGAIGAGLNEALIKALDGKDPGTAQIISAIIGAAAAKVAGGNALAGASAATSGTKWNFFGFAYRPDKMYAGSVDGKYTFVEMVKESLVKEDGSTLSETEAIQLLTDLDNFMMEQEPEKANSRKILVEKFSNIVRVADRLHSLGYTEESVNHFLNRYTDDVNKSSKHPFTYVGIGNGSGFVDSEYIGKDFQFPNYIYDRSSVQSKQNPGIYGWKYVDDILVGVNKNGDIFLDDQHKPVIWEADAAEHPFATKSLKDKIDFVVKQTELFPTKGSAEDFQKEVDQGIAHYADPADFAGAGRVKKGLRIAQSLAEGVSRLNTSTFEISKNTLKHINKRHNAEKFREEIKHLTDDKLKAKLAKRTFFNPNWSETKINEVVTKAYNELRSQGKKGDGFEYDIGGEKIMLVIKATGELDTAYGFHTLTIDFFK